MTSHLSDPLPSPRAELSQVPPALRALVARLLEKDPQRRPTADQALECLSRRGWVNNLSARSFLMMRASWNERLRLVSAAVLLLALLCGAAWALDPVALRIVGSDLVLITRSGVELTRSTPGRPLAAAAVSEVGFGPFRRLWVMTRPPGGVPFPEEERDHHERGLWSAPSPLMPFREVFSGVHSLPYWFSTYSNLGGAFRPRQVILLDNVRREEEPLVALIGTHTPGYPSYLALVNSSGELLSRYDHPGHIRRVSPYRHPETDELYMAGIAFANLAGPRQAVFGVPASISLTGQAPPFTGAIARVQQAGGWYTFLPYRTEGRVMGLRIAAGEVVAQVEGESLRFDARTGAPLDVQVRGGLDVAEWLRRRDALVESLYRAEGLAQSSSPAAGAELLDRFAGEIDAPREMISIAAYRAAILHKQSAQTRGPGAYVAALESIDHAMAAESMPPRYRLLRAELLLRLGRLEELAEILGGWGRQEESLMYNYEYLLLNWLAGTPVPPERFSSPWADSDVINSWAKLVYMAVAYEEGRWVRADQHYATVRRGTRASWNLHSFWRAQTLLDRAEPDAKQALEHLAPEELAWDTGMAIPVTSQRWLAEVLGGGTPSPRLIDDAEVELARFELESASDLHTLFMLSFARSNIARARAANP